MAIGDIIEISLKALRVGVAIRNLYYYRMESGSGSANECMGAFLNAMIPAITPLQHDQVETVHLAGRNLFDPSDSDEFDLSIFGGIAAEEAMADFVAIGMTLVPASAIVRAGAKRIGGLSEAVSGGGRTVDGIYTAMLDTLLTETITDLASGGVPPRLYAPVVVGRIFDPLIGDDGGYRLPLTQIEAAAEGVALIIEAISKGLRSQGSRRYLVGE